MKRFVFRLATVLRVRQHELQVERLALVRVQAVVSACERELERQRGAARRATEQLSKMALEGVRAGELGLAELAVRVAYQMVRVHEEALQEARKPLAVALVNVREAHARARSLELLRERALDEHERAMAQAEQAELDEIGGRMAHYGSGDFTTFERGARRVDGT